MHDPSHPPHRTPEAIVDAFVHLMGTPAHDHRKFRSFPPPHRRVGVEMSSNQINGETQKLMARWDVSITGQRYRDEALSIQSSPDVLGPISAAPASI